MPDPIGYRWQPIGIQRGRFWRFAGRPLIAELDQHARAMTDAIVHLPRAVAVREGLCLDLRGDAGQCQGLPVVRDQAKA